MPLVCSTSVVSYEQFEFIDCSTLNVSYNARGLASVSFSVVSSKNSMDNNYTSLTIGEVDFNGYLDNVQLSVIPGTTVYVYQISLQAFGC